MPPKQTFGSRAQVMHGTAKKTSGGLTKSQLKYNKQGKIVSKKASALAKKNNRLVKAGYITRKGQFGNEMKGGGRSDYNKTKKLYPDRLDLEAIKSLEIEKYTVPGWFTNSWKEVEGDKKSLTINNNNDRPSKTKIEHQDKQLNTEKFE